MIKSAIRIAAVGALAVGALALPGGSASAATVYQEDVTCHVFEQFEYAGTPAQWLVRWYTAGGSNGCTAEIFRGYPVSYPVEIRTIKTTGTDASDWYETKGCADVTVYDRNGTAVYGTWWGDGGWGTC